MLVLTLHCQQPLLTMTKPTTTPILFILLLLCSTLRKAIRIVELTTLLPIYLDQIVSSTAPPRQLLPSLGGYRTGRRPCRDGASLGIMLDDDSDRGSGPVGIIV